MIVRSDFTKSTCLAAMLAAGLMLLAATDMALAGSTVVRDHRGSTTKPAPAPEIGGDKWKGGWENLTGGDTKGERSAVSSSAITAERAKGVRGDGFRVRLKSHPCHARKSGGHGSLGTKRRNPVIVGALPPKSGASRDSARAGARSSR